jgi:peptide/nickel transport system permease protein
VTVTPISAAVPRGLERLRVIWSYPSGAVGLFVVLLFVALAVFAPLIAPYGPFEVVYNADHSVVRLAAPDWRTWLGTTNQGMDVFSQLVWGSRVALLVGLLSAIGSAMIGTLIGLVSGYFGGWIDEVLMRATDIAFGIPFLPFAIVVIAIAKPSLALVILLVVLFLWRTTARVIRSQVLSLKSRGFVWAARAAGASDTHILWRQILPNVLPISFLYMAIGVQAGVMLEAALSFLGFGDPNVQSWGIMLNAAFRAGAMRSAWWWVLPPGVALSMFVIAVFMITRAFEDRLNPQLRMV